MKAKLAVAGLLLVGYVLPAAAETYYIVRDPDKHCSVVSEKPTSEKVTVVNPDGTTYTTKTEAEGAMKTVCHD
jgi:hypothetical protein